MKLKYKPKRIVAEYRQYNAEETNFAFVLKRSMQRRTLSIVITEKGDVRVYIPFFTTEGRLKKFLDERRSWILKGLKWAGENKELLEQKNYSAGNEFLFLGQKFPLQVVPQDKARPRIIFDGEKWMAFLSLDKKDMESDVIKKLLWNWYRKQAEEILEERVKNYSRLMKLEPQKVIVRSLKRIWGNCDFRTKVITFNWQIILSPMEVVDYVVVHEICHLAVPNHSSRFWKKVEQIIPIYKKHSKWLKDNYLEMALR